MNIEKCVLLKEDKNIKPLPLTPISATAKQKMLEWGINEKGIELFRKITSNFRSDLLIQVVRKMCQREIRVTKSPRESHRPLMINFKNWYSYKGRQYGADWDIPHQLCNSNNTKDWLKKINTRLKKQKKTELVLSICWPWTSSRDELFTHYCNLLHQKGGEQKHCIYVNTALQTIELINEKWRKKHLDRSTKPLVIRRSGYFHGLCIMNSTGLSIGYSKNHVWLYWMSFDSCLHKKKIEIMPKLGKQEQLNFGSNLREPRRRQYIYYRRTNKFFPKGDSDMKELTDYEKKLLLEMDELAKKIEEKIKNNDIVSTDSVFKW
ncbi:MAG: hypothetical protein KAS07_04620 [Candidatus Pacebacteria bacterium]|nr:hypothetical protein [Candidatus Paceibacterota bacterium]